MENKQEAFETLTNVANEERKKLEVKNEYQINENYTDGHPNAISDGDEKGKNEIGSSVDILERNKGIVKNLFNNNKTYKGPTL
jgi:hypothetical protein